MLNDEKKGIYELLTPDNCALVLIDYQPQMIFGVGSMQRELLINNIQGICKTARLFNIPTILTTVAAKTFSGEMIEEITKIFPEIPLLDRTTLNTYEDEKVRDEIKKTGKKKLIIGALWTEVCLAFPVLSFLKDGYEVYFLSDTSAGQSKEIHKAGMARMMQAGARPVTWLQVLCELQRDWAREETYDGAMQILKKHAGAYGVGVSYVKNFFNK